MPPLRRVKIGPKLRKTQYIRHPTRNVAVPVPGGISIYAPPYVNKTNRRRDATGSAGARPSEQLPLDDDANNDDEGHGGASLSPTAPMFEGADRASLRINYKGMGSTALSPKYSLSPQKAKETGGPQWESTTAAKPSRPLHSAVDEIAKANPGKPVSNSRDEGYAIAKAAKGECLGVPALLFLKMTGQPLTVATQKAVDKVTIDVITPYVMANTAPRKKQATTQPVGETVALSFASMLQAQAESAAALEGSGNLIEMSLSMLRATTASLASPLVQGYSPPPVTMALVEAAGKWSSNALSFELFRASLPDDEDLRDMVERAALGRREALAGSIA
ncbi:hypothetical protein T492DRAFT_889073, partial [Pavlovales sp. CCMP2436]